MALTWPLEQLGSTGENVKSVRYLLTAQGHAAGVDGVLGAQTKASVEAFQSSHGLGADGDGPADSRDGHVLGLAGARP